MSVFRNKSEILLLEPCDGKLSRTVLRGESARKGADLPAPEAVDIEKRGTEEAAALLMVDTPKGEKPDTVVELPSPFDDQKPLTDLIKVALTDYEGEKITANIQIVVGEDGRIKEVLADGIGDQGIKTAIEQAASQVQFAKVFLDGAAISVRYNIPIRIEK